MTEDTNGPTRDETVAAEVHAPIDVEVERDESRWTLVVRRRFRHGPDLVWRMLTEPDLLQRWSPIVPDRPLTEPGPATCRENPGDDPVDAEVLVADAPRELAHHWGSDLLRWTLIPDRDGTILELRQTTSDRATAVMLAAGWHVCLGRLAAEDDTDRERPTGHRAMAYGWQDLHDRYQDRFAE